VIETVKFFTREDKLARERLEPAKSRQGDTFAFFAAARPPGIKNESDSLSLDERVSLPIFGEHQI